MNNLIQKSLKPEPIANLSNGPNVLIVNQQPFGNVLSQKIKDKLLDYTVYTTIFDSNEIPIEEILDSKRLTYKYLGDTNVEKENNNSAQSNLDFNKQLASAIIQENESRNLSGSLLFHDNLHANHILWNVIQTFILNHKFNSIVFFGEPRCLVESLLYQIATELNIKTIVLIRSVFENHFFSLQKLSDCGIYCSSTDDIDDLRKNITIDYRSGNNIVDHSQCSGVVLEDIWKSVAFLISIRSIKLFNPWFVFKRAKLLHDAPAEKKLWKDPFARFFYCSKSAYFEFLTANPDVDLTGEKQFIFFPLQSIRELHSEILTHRFADQLLALELLATIVPRNFKIIVKDDGLFGADYLSPMFFHRIRRIKNLVRVPSCTPISTLITNCEFLATVSSPKGWTALLKGKNVLVFGRPWYRKLPGCYQYERNMKLKKLLNCSFDKKDLELEVFKLLSKAHYGNIETTSDFSTTTTIGEGNIQSISLTIADLISNKLTTTFEIPSSAQSGV